MLTIRILTAIAVIAIAAPVIYRGIEVLRFLADAAAEIPEEERGAAVRLWYHTPGVSYLARVSALTLVNDADDEDAIGKRVDDLTDILSARPLSSEHWLALSGVQLISGQDSEKALAALGFSSLVGANEGHVMFERGLYGLMVWEDLPAKVRKRTALDLVGAELGDGERDRMRLVLSSKTAEVRQDIRTALVAEGLAEDNVKRIGF